MSGEDSCKWSAKPRREAPATPDLFVCFPARAHMSFMSKPICSPGRTHDPSKRLRSGSHRAGLGSPMFRTKNKPTGPELDEPTSPKVTCAGQVRVKPRSCKNWQSVMEEIERIHENRKNRKPGRPKKKNLSSSPCRGGKKMEEALGFKKDVMQFLSALRNLRFDLRCFGSAHLSDNENSDGEEHEVGDEEEGLEGGSSRTIFSKWFMVLQENQNSGLQKNDIFREEKKKVEQVEEEDDDDEEKAVAPPPNALLLMRCRSAPANQCLNEENQCAEVSDEKKKESLVLMSYAPDFFKISPEIAKETRIRTSNPFSRSDWWIDFGHDAPHLSKELFVS